MSSFRIGISSLVLVAGLGLSQVALAQDKQHHRPTPAEIAQHQVQRYTTLLSLDSGQQSQALSIFTTEVTSAEGFRTSERAAHKALHTAILADDANGIQQAAGTLGQIEGNLTAAHATAQAKFYEILSADQKAKFLLLERDHGAGGGPWHGPHR